MKAVEVVRKEKIDFILAVGGGSVIDGTKFISLAAK
jgi:NADP-dependent alcohol dehydrogenase